MRWLKKICPICALVSLIWLTMLGFKWFGYNVSNELLAMLMGGSAVGISYTLANKLNRRMTVWKLVAIPIAVAGMYALFHFAWGYFLLAALAYLIAWFSFRNIGAKALVQSNEGAVDINKELKNCC